MSQAGFQAMFSHCKIVLILGVLTLGFGGSTLAASSESFWIMGRALILNQPGHEALTLKLSLRNEGKPDERPIQVFCRWRTRGQSRDHVEMVRLGHFRQEVLHKETSILTLSLKPLGAQPSDGLFFLEVLVMTGDRETDRQLVYYHED